MTKRPRNELHRREEVKSDEMLNPAEMLSILQDEVSLISRAADIRIPTVTEIATAYARGELTPQEANRRWGEYEHLWGDAVPGMAGIQGLNTDREFLQFMERSKSANPTWRERLQNLRDDTTPRARG